MRESVIETYAIKRFTAIGREIRKVKWIGRNGAPDRRVMGFAWIEFKATGKKPEPHQEREIARMRKHGERVEVVDSLERVEELIDEIAGEED